MTPHRLSNASRTLLVLALLSGAGLLGLLATRSNAVARASLRLAIIVFRHGNRSPIFSYPTNPYQGPKYWPDGPGQLTKRGKLQLYHLGELLLARYQNLLSHDYNRTEVEVVSTHSDRTFMSAAILLTSLFPPRGSRIWSEHIPWQPIPIWADTKTYNIDIVLKNGTCPAFAKKRITMLAKMEKQFRKDSTPLIAYLEKHTDMKIRGAANIFAIWDALTCAVLDDLELPHWAKNIYPEALKPLIVAFTKTWIGGGDMFKITAGPFLEVVLQRMLTKMQGTLPGKLFLHSAHDVSVLSTLHALNFTQPEIVETSAALVFELHETDEGHHVEVLYIKNSKAEEPERLQLPGCAHPCSLNDFSDLVHPLVTTPEEWRAECHRHS